VVDLHLSGVLADLAGIREEPGEQFLVRVVDTDRLPVGDRCRFPAAERYLAEPCDQWLLPWRSIRASKQVRSP
jgi:hypothetical protein